jgi:hypothetical protein
MDLIYRGRLIGQNGRMMRQKTIASLSQSTDVYNWSPVITNLSVHCRLGIEPRLTRSISNGRAHADHTTALRASRGPSA